MHNHDVQDFRLASAPAPHTDQPTQNPASAPNAQTPHPFALRSSWACIIAHPTTDQRNAATAGVRAADWGKLLIANPHRVGTKRWRAWRNGWLWLHGRFVRNLSAIHPDQQETAIIDLFESQHPDPHPAAPGDAAVAACLEAEDVEQSLAHLRKTHGLYEGLGMTEIAAGMASTIARVMEKLGKRTEARKWKRASQLDATASCVAILDLQPHHQGTLIRRPLIGRNGLTDRPRRVLGVLPVEIHF